MEEVQREFYQIVRTFMMRYFTYAREKGEALAHIEDVEQMYVRLAG